MATGLHTPHTASPASQDEDLLLWLRLIRSRRVGATTFHRLLAEHGDVASALAALPDIAAAAGVENYALCPLEVVRHEMALGRAAQARLLLWGQPDYPSALMDLPDAPPVLWAQGRVELLTQPMVAMVGARNASSLGLRMARRLSESLGAAGMVIVSGLARGIDAEAHQAALATGTVAVQAGGVDVVYPLENAALAAEIASKGCRISEQPMATAPQVRHFPQRNRIVSGLARAVVVVEAAARSGSLITAKTALDQGREVLAVPGHPFDARAEGCNLLLRDGATLIRSAQDVLEAVGLAGSFAKPAAALPPLNPAAKRAAPRNSAPRAADPAPALPDLPGPVPPRRALADVASVHSLILARLGPSPLAEDQLIRDLAMPPATLAPALITLELEGRIERQSGGLLSRLDPT
jgi:DNA processing protein